MSSLYDIDEDTLTKLLKSILVAPPYESVGIGDDCAVTDEGLLLKTDCMVEGRHYVKETPSEKVGQKAIARVLSDFAAMGGEPSELLVTIGLRQSTKVQYVKDLYMGMDRIASEFGCVIVGGETTSVDEGNSNFISISGTGKLLGTRPCLRSGASVGDLIYVTGALGGSFPSDHHLDFVPRLAESKWLVENCFPSAMMDLSDGLAKDLPRLSRASQVGYQLDYQSIPIRPSYNVEHALKDGEDYELLFTVAPSQADLLKGGPFTQIGEITKGVITPLDGGWDHFNS